MLAWRAMHMIKDKQNPLELSASEQKRVEKEIQDRLEEMEQTSALK